VTATTVAVAIGIDRYQVQDIHQMSVGAAFMTSAFRIDERCANPERGRYECCPYGHFNTGKREVLQHCDIMPL
jgi:hypothetical protein